MSPAGATNRRAVGVVIEDVGEAARPKKRTIAGAGLTAGLLRGISGATGGAVDVRSPFAKQLRPGSGELAESGQFGTIVLEIR